MTLDARENVLEIMPIETLKNLNILLKEVRYNIYYLLNIYSSNQDNYKENINDYFFTINSILFNLKNSQIHQDKNDINYICDTDIIQRNRGKILTIIKNLKNKISSMNNILLEINDYYNKNKELLFKLKYNNIVNKSDSIANLDLSDQQQKIIFKLNSIMNLILIGAINYGSYSIVREYIRTGFIFSLRKCNLSNKIIKAINTRIIAIEQSSKSNDILRDEITKLIENYDQKLKINYFDFSKNGIIYLNIDKFPFKINIEIPNFVSNINELKSNQTNEQTDSTNSKENIYSQNIRNFKVSVYSLYENIATKSNSQNILVKKEFSDYLLFEKIRNLFEMTIKNIFYIVNEERTSTNDDINTNKNYINNLNNIEKNSKGELMLIKLIMQFIEYINGYDKLFNIKCLICNKYVKYSINEKCFFPPYYKQFILGTQKSEFLNKLKPKDKNTDNNVNLFTHEECFAKLNSTPL